MPWQILALTSIVTMAISSIFQRLVMRDEKSDAITTSIIFQILLTIYVLIYALINGFTLPALGPVWINISISGIFWGIVTLLYFWGLKTVDAAEATIYSSINALVTIIASVIFLGEKFGVSGFIGTSLILSSVYIIQGQGFKMKISKGVFAILLSSVFSGLAITNDVFILRSVDLATYVTIASFLPAVVIFMVYPKSSMKNTNLIKNFKFMKSMLILTFFYGIQAITYYEAIAHGANASQLQPLFKSYIILVVILGAVFLNERQQVVRKIVSGLLAIVGVVFLMY